LSQFGGGAGGLYDSSVCLRLCIWGTIMAISTSAIKMAKIKIPSGSIVAFLQSGFQLRKIKYFILFYLDSAVLAAS
jgi:hypothetical protein